MVVSAPEKLPSGPRTAFSTRDMSDSRPILAVGLLVLLACAGGGRRVLAQATTSESLDIQKGLATEICRSSLIRMSADPLTTEAMETAVRMIHEAVELDPDNPDFWRVQLEIAGTAEREELVAQSIDRLVQLEGSDDVIRLMRLKLALDRFNTVEERQAALQRMLADDNIAKMGSPVASRLALDLALLQRRSGDTEAFAASLSKALELDPANRTAAALAAGYFRMNINDAFAEAELLVNLMLADLTDVPTQVALAQHLLERGAYVGANRIYRLAVRSTLANKGSPTTELLMDQAVALWASGDDEAALTLIRQRQQQSDVMFRRMMLNQQPTMSGLELMEYRAPIEPTLGAVRAAILSSRKDPDAAEAVQQLLESYKTILEALAKEAQTDSASMARINLEAALVTAWLGTDISSVEQFVAEADKLEPLSPQARARFEGWLAYRRGEFERAVEVLTPVASSDPPAQCGLALALLAQGRTREAARELLAAARQRPGTTIGVWAARELFAVVGQRASVSPEAARMDELIASINPVVDRYPTDPSLAMGFRVIPARDELGPYEPVILNVELTNQSVLPLALDRSGPVRPQLLLDVNFNSAYMPDLGDIPPLVIDINRRLRLMPRERIVIPINLRQYAPGRVLNALALNGCILRIKVMLNFVGTTQAVVEPGLLGTEVEVPLIRVEGVRSDAAWLQQTMAAVQEPDFAQTPDAARVFAQLCHKAAVRPLHAIPEEEFTLITEAVDVIKESFSKLSPLQQAWVLSVVPPAEPLRAALEQATESPERLVQLSYLLFRARGSGDPILAKLESGDDPALARLAQLLQIAVRQVEEMRAREAELRGGANISRGAPGQAQPGQPATAPATQPAPRSPRP
jgi:tetratricopeptide (TPR) repeat protein